MTGVTRSPVHFLEEKLLAAMPRNAKLAGLRMGLPYTMPSMAELDRLADELYGRVAADYKPGMVLGLLQSGFYPSYRMAEKFGCDIDFARVSTNYVRDILFLQHFTYMRDPVTRETEHRLMWKTPKRMDGRRVLVVDDESSSGSTLRVGKALAESKGASEVRTAVLVDYNGQHADYDVVREPYTRAGYRHLPSRRYSPFFEEYSGAVARIHEEMPSTSGMG